MCGHPKSEHGARTKRQWLECACCDDGNFLPGGHYIPFHAERSREMSAVPSFKKQVWVALYKYFKELNQEYKRNGTIEGKALGTPDQGAPALRALSRVDAVLSKKANATVKEQPKKTARKSGKAASTKKIRKPRSKKSFEDIPSAVDD
jgi:hypothetical protein